MNILKDSYIQGLNGLTVSDRLNALKEVKKLMDLGEITPEEGKGYVNNHIHTTYSFSPYSPTKAVYMANMAGLLTAGIVDHDSISGAQEFIEAGRILGMPTTIGIECRVSMANSPFSDKRLNNTDQKGIAYVAMHGIPHTQIDTVKAFIAPYLEHRQNRNQLMVDNINGLFAEKMIDFETDVKPISMAHDGGSITERHLLYALSLKLIEKQGKGEALLNYLLSEFSITISGKLRELMLDESNVHYAYDLLGVLKGHFVSKFYIDATTECPEVTDFIAKAKEVGAISAYAYLGDIRNSITGDKRDDFFEDSYIVELVDYLKAIGFDAITYMPSRNTKEQLDIVRGLCDKNELFQISGEDINSPRQSFVCEALLKPDFANLIEATWAMIGHENEGTKDLSLSMFSDAIISKMPSLDERISYFYKVGREER